jgi:hypothetical protein
MRATCVVFQAVVDEGNMWRLRALVPGELGRGIVLGETVSIFQRGETATVVYHKRGRAAQRQRSQTVWGDWEMRKHALRTACGRLFGVSGHELVTRTGLYRPIRP